MARIFVKRGTRAQINAAAALNGLNQGEVYLITDESRLAVGLGPNSVSDTVKLTELKTVGGFSIIGTGDIPVGGSGVTNLSGSVSPTGVTVNSDTGTDYTIPLADGTNAGLMAPADFTKLSNLPDNTTLTTTLAGKQATLVSGTNIKTVNSISLLGSGNVAITGGTTATAFAAASGAIDYNNGVYQTLTVASNTTLSFANWPASGTAASLTLEINHTGGTITFPASVVWANNTAPVLATSRVHVITFLTRNGGTTVRGFPQTNFTS